MSVVGLKTFARDVSTPDTYAGVSTEKAIQLHTCGEQLLQAAALGDADRCRELCGMLPSGVVIKYKGRDGRTALHIAASKSPEDTDLVGVLLDLGADPLCIDAHEARPKDLAARMGNWAVHRQLVGHTDLFIPLAQAGVLTRVLGYGTWKHHRTVMLRSCRLFRDTVKAGVLQGCFKGYGIDWANASSKKLFGKTGTEAGAVKCVRDITLDAEGNIYLAEQDTRRVQMFTQEGQLLKSFGCEGTANGQFLFNGAFSAHIDHTRQLIYASSPGNHFVNVFSSRGGQVVRVIGKGVLSTPQGVVSTREGQVVVADAGMNKIVVFGENGTLLRTWLGVLQTKPYGVVMVTTRIVAVTQVDHNEVVCIDIESGVSWVALTLPGSETGGRGIAHDVDDNLLITTQDTAKLYVFAPVDMSISNSKCWEIHRVFSLKDFSYGVAVHPQLGLFVCGYNNGKVLRLDNFSSSWFSHLPPKPAKTTTMKSRMK